MHTTTEQLYAQYNGTVICTVLTIGVGHITLTMHLSTVLMSALDLCHCWPEHHPAHSSIRSWELPKGLLGLNVNQRLTLYIQESGTDKTLGSTKKHGQSDMNQH